MKESSFYKLLILEDDIDLAMQWNALFVEQRIRVDHAQTVAIAKSLCSQYKYDAVVCDIFIQDAVGRFIPEGGIKLLNYLHIPSLVNLPEFYKSIPKVAVTGAQKVNGFDVLDLVKTLGCHAVMRKPFEPIDLVEKVLELLSEKSSK